MKNFKKILLVTSSIIAITTSSFADTAPAEKLPIASDIKVDFSGYADFQAGLRNQNHLEQDEKNTSRDKENFAFFSSTALVANISNQLTDVKYGAKIILVPTAKRKSNATYNGSHMYIESDYGRFEAGSPFTAASTMMIDGTKVATTPGSWSRYAELAPAHITQGKALKPSFATSTDFFLDDKLATNFTKRTYSSEPPRSIAYYTPKLSLTESTKVQIGVSYTPHTANTGADNIDVHSSGINVAIVDAVKSKPTDKIQSDEIHRFEIDNSVKNAVAGAVAIEQHITDGVDLSFAVSGETGKSAGKVQQFTKKADTKPEKEFTLSNLRTYNIGTALNVGNMSYSASFGSLGKSLTTPEFHRSGRHTNYYSATIAYKQGPFATSISYFKSDQFKNTADAITIGTNYQLAPGFKPYVEISSFTLKGRSEFDKELEKKSTRGTVAVIGAKLSL